MPYLLQTIGSTDKLFALAFDERFPPAIASDVGKRNIRDARLKAAVKDAAQRGDYSHLVRLLVELSTIAAVNLRGSAFLVAHPGLVILSHDVDALRRLFQVRTKWPGTRHARLAIANALSDALDDAYRHVASATEWIYHYLTSDSTERMDAGGPEALDIASVPLCMIAQGRATDAADYMGKYFDWYGYEVSQPLFECLDQARNSGVISGSKIDAFLRELKSQLGVLAGVLSFASLTEKNRVQFIRKLASTAKRNKRIRRSGRAAEDGIKDGLRKAAGLAISRGLSKEAQAILSVWSSDRPSAWSYIDRYSEGIGSSFIIDTTLNALARGRQPSERDFVPQELVSISSSISSGLKGSAYRKALLTRLEEQYRADRKSHAKEEERRLSYETKRNIEDFMNSRFEHVVTFATCFGKLLTAKRGKADQLFLGLVERWNELGRRSDAYTDQTTGAIGFGFIGLRLVLFALSTRDDLKPASIGAAAVVFQNAASVTVSAHIELCSILAKRPVLHALAGSVAASAKECIKREDYVDTRAGYFAALAHALLPASPAEALSYFKLGLEQLDAIGAGDYQFTNELLLFAASLRSQELSPSEFHTLGNICELNMGSEEQKFPWYAFAKGMASVAGMPMLARIGRWEDRDKISLAHTLLPYLTALIERRKISPESALGLMQLADSTEWYNCDTGDFAQALHKNGYSNEGALVREIIKQFLESGSATLVRAPAEKLLELSNRILGTNAAESKYLGWAAPRAERLIKEQNDHNSYHGEDDRLNRPTPRELRAEESNKRAALKQIARATNPANEMSLSRAIDRFNSLGPVYELKGLFFLELRKRVKYSDRIAYVENVARLDNLLIYWKFAELHECKTAWGSSTTSLADTFHGLALPLVQDNADELVSHDSFSSSLLKDISDLSEISMADLSLEVAKLFAKPDAHFSAAVWLALASIAIEKADHAAGLIALRRLLNGNSVRLAESVTDGSFRGELYPPADEVQICAGLVWLQLGSPAASDRWRAAHSLRCFARFQQWEVLDAVVAKAFATDAGPFQATELPFYCLHARLWLLIALARIARDHPRRVAHYEPTLKSIALCDSEPHVVIRHFAAETILTCRRAGHCGLSAAETAKVETLNASPFGPPQQSPGGRDGYYQGRPKGTPEPQNSFHLEIDFEKEAIDGLARVFAASHWEVDDLVTKWVRRFDSTIKSMYESKGRSSSETRRQIGLISEFHGYGQQLALHATWLAAGELLATRPVAIPEYGYSDGDPWLDWLRRYLLSRADGAWLADGTDYPPPEMQVNLLEKGTHGLVLTGNRSTLLALVGLEFGLRDAVVVRGDWKSADGMRVLVSSALVEPEESKIRMEELLETEPFFAWLPAFDQQEGQDEWLANGKSGYEPWVVSPSDEVRLDGDDPLCANSDAARRPYLAKAINTIASLTAIDAFRRKWVDARGRVAAHAEAWGREFPHREDGSWTGKRLVLSVEALRTILTLKRRDLLILISIERYQSSRYSSDEGGFSHSIAVCHIAADLALKASVGRVNHRHRRVAEDT